MKISCVIIDDEPIACNGMAEYVAQVDFLELKGIFENPMEAYSMLNSGAIDLMLLDIEMPGLSGIELIKSLKVVPAVIFTTAYTNYAVDGYELDAIDFLVKPVAFHRFLKAVNKLHDYLGSKTSSPEKQDNGYFFVKENGRYTRISYCDIIYAEALQNYVCIHLENRKVITYITLTMLENQLPPQLFLKVHKSYIVSLDKVSSVFGGTVRVGDSDLPVSRTCKDLLMQKLGDKGLLKR